MRERTIIHINVADFAVAVERLVDSRLREQPVIIAPERAVRSVVYDMSEESYQNGVRKGMPLQQALRYCRDAIVIPPHPDRYERAMTRLLKHALPYSPLVEMTDHNGHLFVDATGTERLFGPASDVAWKIRKAVRNDMRFDPIWSVAPNKLLAKVATRMVKPTGEYILRAGDEADFLKPLPLHLIPGIEGEDLKRLQEFNLTCVGHVVDLSREQLHFVFGNRSFGMYDAVRGIDPSPVSPAGQQPPRVMVDHDFGNDTNDMAVMGSVLFRLVEKAGADLRRRRLAAKRIGILLDYADGKRTISHTAVHPATANDLRLFETGRVVLERIWKRRIRVRHMRLVCDRLTYPSAQLGLFPEHEKEKKAHDDLMTALDTVRRRFGFKAIYMGRTLNPNIS